MAAKFVTNFPLPKGVADIFYLSEDSDQNTKLFRYQIKTHTNMQAWEAHTHPLLVTSGTVTITAAKGLTIKINPASMKGEIVTFGDRSEIVEIAYPIPQSRQAMIKNAENLEPVQ